MITKRVRLSAFVSISLLAGLSAGCGAPAQSNVSPTPEQDVERHEQAVRYANELASKNKQAEREAMSRIGRSLNVKPKSSSGMR